MTTVFQNTDIIAPGNAIGTGTTPALVNGQRLFVAEGTNVVSTGSTAINATDETIYAYDMTIFGTVYGDGSGIVLRNNSGSTAVTMEYSVYIGETGSVIGSFYGLNLYDDGSDISGEISVINDGVIGTIDHAGMFLGASSLTSITNTGHIYSMADDDFFDSAVIVLNSNTYRLTNTGLIENRASADTGSSFDAREAAAVRFSSPKVFAGSLAELTNSGTISGPTHSFYADMETIRLTNSGTMNGTVFFNNSTGTGSIVNSGTINGDLNLDSAVDTVRNSGTVNGDVLLGGGADLFDGRGGTVTGEVAGGGGDDTYIIDDASIALSEGAGQGTDEVQSLVSFTLGENFEILTLLGTGDISGFGNEDNNTLTGNNGDNVLGGLGGDDILYGLHGDDLLSGGNSNDELFGGSGRDTLDGGNGNDTLAGQGGDDWLLGRTGNDLLNGSDGDDTLAGGLGDDTLNGGDGTDILIGGGGQDFMRGNDGSDVFRFLAAQDSSDAAPDRILDFVHNEDFIDLRALIDGALPMAIGGAASGTGPSAWTQEVGANTVVRVDVDGDGLADMRFDLIGTLGVSESDFML